jgi:hypothetical protein
MEEPTLNGYQAREKVVRFHVIAVAVTEDLRRGKEDE